LCATTADINLSNQQEKSHTFCSRLDSRLAAGILKNRFYFMMILRTMTAYFSQGRLKDE
jgi:hypothetical protein